ncbi:hypothetical protein RUND412_010287 [Rhizina undulata]
MVLIPARHLRILSRQFRLILGVGLGLTTVAYVQALRRNQFVRASNLKSPLLSKTANANTARLINKRKLSEYENDIEDVRPDPSIPYIPPAPKRTAIGEIIDPRIFDGANQLINGIWMVPRTCNACKNTNHFCNRDSPCEGCAKAGRAYIRNEGLVSARCRSYRLSESGTSTLNPIPVPASNSGTGGADLLGTGKGNIPKNPKKRPRTVHKSATAREDVKEPEPTIVKDYQAG